MRLLIALGVLVVASIAAFFLWPTVNHLLPRPQVACTQEARICPDGSAVGRTGPNCEFAACPEALATNTLGTYSYECDEHVAFTMTPASDMSSVAVAPNGATGTYPPQSTLVKKEATSGVRYEGNGVVFTARGETVTLGEGDSAINCSPVQNPDMAPFNFGD